jgi:hypothetical protein
VLAVEIGGFDISRKLFSNEFGLSVFEVLEKETERTFISDYSHLLLQSFSTLSETILEKIELEEPMTVEELESILTNAERKKVISEDNKLAAFFERKSRGQKQEAAAKRNKTSIAQQGESKTSRHAWPLLVEQSWLC